MDYVKLGLKAGLEIHQQLDVGRKLFCNCPAFLRSEEPDFVVKRKLHAVAGEAGEVDIAVEYESGLKKEFVYQGYSDNNCSVELDEEPPHFANEEALDEVLKIALLLNCEIYPVTQVMRKTVIDGSNTSGFQRTFLVAHDGFLEMDFGKVGIASVALEEDSARLVSDKKGKEVIFRLDRLGIPLVEIGTKADLKNPEQIKECALKLGEILRACRVKRGIGTIRQDLNISVKGHDRVEIKGFQEPKIMLKSVELEVERQLDDLKKSKRHGEVRNSLDDGKTEFLRPIPGGARMYPETDLPLIYLGRERINRIKKELPRLRNEIRDELKKNGLSEELSNLVLSHRDLVDEFNTLIVYSKDANLVGKMITLWRQEFAAKLGKSVEQIKDILNERVLESVLEHVRDGKLNSSHVKEVLFKILEGAKLEEALHVDKVDDNELEKRIREIVQDKPGLRENAYMGLVLKEFGNRVDKRKAMDIIKKILQ